jgi:hypothetical protein
MTPEERKAYNAAYRSTHKEEIRANKAAYRSTHKEKLRTYNSTQKEEMKAYQAAWYKAHRKEVLASSGAYYDAHREEILIYRSTHKEIATVRSHYKFIFKCKSPCSRSYKGMSFYDGWNPDKGGSYKAGGEWIIENIGKCPENSSLHIIHHDIGFMPGNLEWTYPKKQNNQQMYKIIAQQRHQIRNLKRQLIEVQQVIALAA